MDFWFFSFEAIDDGFGQRKAVHDRMEDFKINQVHVFVINGFSVF